ncbi:unnamed protein product, partial [Brassica rapa]
MISHPFHSLKKFLTCRFGSSYSDNGFEIWLMLQVSKSLCYHVSSHRSLLSKEGRYSSIQGIGQYFLIVFCLMRAGEGNDDLEEHSEWHETLLRF